mmetsp:Transcript_16691/g.42725  ORF Transcript_16691/g.42725 Transcript_16691/m.42725 type:complete len:391 (+) Transcript_16691:41-1213(+)
MAPRMFGGSKPRDNNWSTRSESGSSIAADDSDSLPAKSALETVAELRKRVEHLRSSVAEEERAIAHAKHAMEREPEHLRAAAASLHKALIAAGLEEGELTEDEEEEVEPVVPIIVPVKEEEEEVPVEEPEAEQSTPSSGVAAVAAIASSPLPPPITRREHASYHYYTVRAPRGLLGLWFNDNQEILKINPLSPLLVISTTTPQAAVAKKPSKLPRRNSSGLGGLSSPRPKVPPTSPVSPGVGVATSQPRPRIGDKLVLLNGKSTAETGASYLANALISAKDGMRVLVFLRAVDDDVETGEIGAPPRNYSIFAPRGRLGLGFDNHQKVCVVDAKSSPFQLGISPPSLALGDRLTHIDGVTTQGLSADSVAAKLLSRITDDHRVLDFESSST